MNVYGEQENCRAGCTATVSSTEPGGSTANAFDGNLKTRWSAGAGKATGQWFEVDEGSPQWLNQIVMDVGPNKYPRGYIVQVSNDNTNWQTVANAEGTSPWVSANFPSVQDRYIRVTIQESSGNCWSTSEFRVFQ